MRRSNRNKRNTRNQRNERDCHISYKGKAPLRKLKPPSSWTSSKPVPSQVLTSAKPDPSQVLTSTSSAPVVESFGFAEAAESFSQQFNRRDFFPDEEDPFDSNSEQEAAALVPIQVDENSSEQEGPATFTWRRAFLYAFFWVLMHTLSDKVVRIGVYAFGFPFLCKATEVPTLATYVISLFIGSAPLWDFFMDVWTAAVRIHRENSTEHLTDRFRVAPDLGFTPSEFLAEERREKILWLLRGLFSVACLLWNLISPLVLGSSLPYSGNVTIPFIPLVPGVPFVPVAPPHRGA